MSEHATKTTSLLTRASTNKNFGESDFDSWTRSLIDPVHFKSALDICCGTGNQLVIYSKRSSLEKLVGIDISQGSLDIANNRLDSSRVSLDLVCSPMEAAFSDPRLYHKFDIISCFYGLYYAKNPAKVLDQMIDSLAPGGTILIVGPYGDNNKTLFDLLEKFYELPNFVTWSSTIFMNDVVIPKINEKLSIKQNNFLNKIRYPTAEAILDYWKASTFYISEYDRQVSKSVEQYFQKNSEFVIEKHVMAVTGRKSV